MEKWNNDYIYIPVKGSAIMTMPRLVKNKHSILTAAELMDRKIEAANSGDKKLIESYFGLDDNREGIFVLQPMFYQKNGNFKIADIKDPNVLEYVKNMKSNGNEFGGYILDDDFALENIEGVEFTKVELIEFANKPLSKRKAKRNLILQTLAENNQERLDEFIESTYKIASKKFDYTGKMMNVNMPNPNYDLKNIFGMFWFGGIRDDYANVAATHSMNFKSVVLIKELSSKLIQKYIM